MKRISGICIGGALVALLGVCPAFAVDLFVATTGSDTGSCQTKAFPCASLAYALGVSGHEDVIKIAAGTFPTNVNFSQNFGYRTIQGGWNETFDAMTADPSLSVLDGGGLGPVIRIILNSSGFTIENLTVTHGDGGSDRAGGIDVSSGGGARSITIRDTIIAANSDTGFGAGIKVSARGGAAIELELSRNKILANQADQSGAGVSIHTSDTATVDAMIENNVIEGNSTINGHYDGLLFSEAGAGSITADLINNTLFDQRIGFWTSSSSAAGTATRITITNTVFESVFVDGDLVPGRAYAAVSYSWFQQPVYDPNGNIRVENSIASDADPLFEDPSVGDYHLRYGSPLIDAGICRVGAATLSAITTKAPPTVRIAPDTDIDGQLRPTTIEGCDIGADEFIALIPGPETAEVFSYAAPIDPVASNKAGECAPFAVGDLTGGTVDLSVGLPDFADPVDVYVGITSDTIVPGDIILLVPDGLALLSAQGLVPWHTGVTGLAAQSLFGEIPLSGLPAGVYGLYVMTTPTLDLSLGAYYLWISGFTVP